MVPLSSWVLLWALSWVHSWGQHYSKFSNNHQWQIHRTLWSLGFTKQKKTDGLHKKNGVSWEQFPSPPRWGQQDRESPRENLPARGSPRGPSGRFVTWFSSPVYLWEVFGLSETLSEDGPYPQYGWDFLEEIPEKFRNFFRKRSQSVSWNFPREYGWDAPSPIIQGIWGFQSVSRILSPPVRLGSPLFSELVPERASQSWSWNSQQYWGCFWEEDFPLSGLKEPWQPEMWQDSTLFYPPVIGQFSPHVGVISLQEALGPSGPKCPGECPRECPRKSGCPRERVSGGVSRGPFGPQSVQKVSRECLRSVKKVSGHSGDTLGTPFGHFGARGPKGPRDTPPDTLSDTPIFGDTLSDTPRDTSSPKGPKPPVEGWGCLNTCWGDFLSKSRSRPGERGTNIHLRKLHKIKMWGRRPETADFCPLSWSNVSWLCETLGPVAHRPVAWLFLQVPPWPKLLQNNSLVVLTKNPPEHFLCHVAATGFFPVCQRACEVILLCKVIVLQLLKNWLCQQNLGGHFGPDKKIFSPPPPPNSPIRRRHPPGPSAPPPLGEAPPPLLGDSIKITPPPSRHLGLPLPPPRAEKIKNISETSTKQFWLQAKSFFCNTFGRDDEACGSCKHLPKWGSVISSDLKHKLAMSLPLLSTVVYFE